MAKPSYNIDPDGIGRPERGEATKVGDTVKVLFRSKPGGGYAAEGMWVKVTAATETELTGTLENYPVTDVGADYGDEVVFPRTAVRVVQ